MNLNSSVYVIAIACLVLLCSCSSDGSDPDLENPIGETPSPDPGTEPDTPQEPIIEVNAIPASEQRVGNATVGYEYLVSGEYMSSGVPYDVFVAGNGENNQNLLNRNGDNAIIPHDYTAASASNGVRIVSPNCMSCHSGFLDNELMVGLGNHSGDFTINRANEIELVSTGVSLLYGQNSDEWEAFDQFRKGILAIGPTTTTQVVGANPADRITQVLASHRDKNTLEWSDSPYVALDEDIIPTDVPAWWLLKKKNAMFYHGLGRKDFCKSFIGSSLLTLTEKEKAEEVNEKMPDVLAYIYSIEAPSYPNDIDANLANVGSLVFEEHCVKCHGSYGENESYPNLLVSLKTIGTDPALSNRYSGPSQINDYFLDWFNNGWFGTDENPLEFKAEGGYVAPPLDGVWATAPYFHNGSVPTLELVLNSTERPIYWSRTFDSSDFNTNELGWNYVVETSKKDKYTYDTTLKGYGNGGHTFGDILTTEERTALLEYLKTL